jgi:hypothetical protein
MTKFAAVARRVALAGTGLALAASSPAFAEDASVVRRLTERGISYKVDGDGDYKVTYNYKKEGRSQLVFVSGRTESVGGFSVREVYSPAARVEKDGIDGTRALDLLRESSKNKLGSWEIRGDVVYFVIKLSDSMNAAELESAMDIASETADDMELKISGARDDL